MKLSKRIGLAIVALLVALVALGTWYVQDYYHADSSALAALEDPGHGVEVRELHDGDLAFVSGDARVGLVFYPGAKVEPEAYAPLLVACAERDVLCVLVRPPLNLAILDEDAARDAFVAYPEVDTWIVAGHSMGGVAASSFVAHNEDDVDALVLLGSYASSDLSDYAGDVVSLVGTNDGVLNWAAYERAKVNLPRAAEFKTIDGGNHAYYGNYGEQAGDGKATISRAQQQSVAADAIAGIALDLDA